MPCEIVDRVIPAYPTRVVEVRFGKDRHYDIRLEINRKAVDDTASDGVDRYGAACWFGGLTPPDHPSESEQECTAWRSLGEDELRMIASAFLRAAGILKRMESDERRRKKGHS